MATLTRFARRAAYPGTLGGLDQESKVPYWVPWPLPYGWLVTGFSGAGDERRGAAVRLSPCPGRTQSAGRPTSSSSPKSRASALARGLAGLKGIDPVRGSPRRPHATVRVGGTGCLWLVVPGDSAGPGRCAAFAGEVGGGWVWIVFRPDSAAVMLVGRSRCAACGTPSSSGSCRRRTVDPAARLMARRG